MRYSNDWFKLNKYSFLLISCGVLGVSLFALLPGVIRVVPNTTFGALEPLALARSVGKQLTLAEREGMHPQVTPN